MSRNPFQVIGVAKTAKRFHKLGNHIGFDKIAQQSMKEIQSMSNLLGPVDTGNLTENLAADRNRIRTPGRPLGSYDLLDGTEYTFVQEFEHRSMSHFIRNSVHYERPEFEKKIAEWAKGKGR